MSSRRLSLCPDSLHPLSDLLLKEGVEFPCGGAGTCGDCRVRVLSGEVPVTSLMRDLLSPTELEAGWRLGCCAAAHGPTEVEVAQWKSPILSDDSSLPVEPRPGFGVVIDLGTTTLVVQCVDLETGEIAGTEASLNPQGRFGADVMSRIQHEMRCPGELTILIRQRLGELLLAATAGRRVEEVLVVGNTAMHHLFCGLDVAPLAAVPFRTETPGACTFHASELHWPHSGSVPVVFLPCVGGFVGSDLLSGLVACGIDRTAEPSMLLDLGTNGEIAFWDGTSILCASTAAGPAFEGGGISCGMRAANGAIHRVEISNDSLSCHVIGGGEPRGICGSGLLDAAACALDLGWLQPSGRIADGDRTFAVADEVLVSQRDVRELQLAKGAVAGGIELLIGQTGGEPPCFIHLAGAFGNYLREASARRVGLLPSGNATVCPEGNSALRGARMLLLSPSVREERIRAVLDRTRHVELAALPEFQDVFAGSLRFPN